MPEFISVVGGGLRAHHTKTVFENAGFSTQIHPDAAGVIVVACDTQDEAEELYFGSDALVSHASSGALIINVSPVSATLAHEVETMALISDIQFVHAGMYASDITSMTPFASPEEVTLFVGGEDTAVSRAREVLSRISAHLIMCGSVTEAISATLALYLKRMAHIVSVVEMRTFLRQSLLTESHDSLDARLAVDEDEADAWENESASARSLSDDQRKKLSTLSDTVLSTLDVSPQDFAMLELIDSGEVHAGYPLLMLRGEIQTALFAAQEMGVIFPHAEAGEQLLALLMIVGAHELGIGAIGLLFEDDETCKRAGIDWARARDAAGHTHDTDDDSWDEYADDETYESFGFGDEHREFGGEFGSYSAN